MKTPAVLFNFRSYNYLNDASCFKELRISYKFVHLLIIIKLFDYHTIINTCKKRKGDDTHEVIIRFGEGVCIPTIRIFLPNSVLIRGKILCSRPPKLDPNNCDELDSGKIASYVKSGKKSDSDNNEENETDESFSVVYDGKENEEEWYQTTCMVALLYCINRYEPEQK